ncbi:MAG: GPR1/FUN34/YaaH family transporter [Chloroflexi bacterium]|nr:GPR1/FUN34/YaaH family transporter [Chloroflexota bacterium]
MDVRQTPESLPTEIHLSPIAPPSILGLYGFAGATFIVAANLAGWYGTPLTGDFLFPFAAMFGGLAQFLAGMWSFRARDAIASAMHGMWGSFWMGYGILWLLVAIGILTPPTPFVALGYWFIPLAIFTATGAWAAAAGVDWALFFVLGFLALGSALMAVGQIFGSAPWVTGAGYAFIISAILAWYTGTALMMRSATGRKVLPVGEVKAAPAVSVGIGEPGVMHGQ